MKYYLERAGVPPLHHHPPPLQLTKLIPITFNISNPFPLHSQSIEVIMLKAEELGFDINKEGIIMLCATFPHFPSTEPDTIRFQEGDAVILNKGGEDVQILITERKSDGTYHGKVTNIDIPEDPSKLGFKNGDIIHFSHKHIFGCGIRS
jgi:hypothetical protein